jgi:serine phosphatase RsbU (regulator of sigma subunit)/anti-sigma regulatory factor (Ser/Thr protein kinase)
MADTKGLEGDSGRVVAFANSKLPGWTIVLDRSRSEVFAAARRSFVIEMISIIAAALVAAGLVAWAISRSRRELAAERDQMRRWDELAQSLGEASAASEVSAALGSALTTAFPGADVIVALHDDERGGFRVWTYGGGERGPLDRRAPGVTEVARLVFSSGSPLRLTDPAVLESLLAPLAGRIERSPGELFTVPMRSQVGVTIGSSTLLLPSDTRLGGSEEALVVAHTEYAARALGRARRSEREHDVAVALQRSLLPAALPPVDGIEVAARYNAGADDLEVGGDWYGLIRRPDGIVHLTVGDVAGRGVTAAVLMGQLRYAFRALAYELIEPGEIARRLSRLVPEGGMATATFLALDPYTGELSYASAGHPPSMLLDSLSGEVTLLDQGAAPPLGWTGLEGLEEGRLTLHSGMTLLAYTDGLVERRGFGIDEGIDDIAELLGRRSQLGAEQMADEILETIAAPVSASDDIALLIIQLLDVPSVMNVEVPADPSILRSLRARINAWLERRGVDELKRLDAILAVSEACNNAIEHAYADGEGMIRLTIEHAAGALRIVVEDAGRWREGTPDPTRGRGLMIMRETRDAIDVVSSEAGTRVELELRLVETPAANEPTSTTG